MIEETGRTREEAVARALATLGISESEAVVTVLDEKKRRFLGLFGDAIVRVRVERRRDARGGARSARGGRASGERGAPPRGRPRKTVDTAGDAERVRDVVGGILTAMGIDSRVAVVEVDGVQCVRVESQESDGLLIGRRGQTLDALEHVANRILTRARDDRPVVTVDVAGYRERNGDAPEEPPARPAGRIDRGRRRSRGRARAGAS